VDAAHRLFTIAVEKNFVQGRRTTHVVAACLYISCRQEKSQHMLIDFSDALQVNVYTLGTCFLKFRRLLGLKLEIIDPALYVYRFAAHLELDEKANAVALTALRLVGRMKRDWIVAGRRPAGICAAALLIAARAHGFSRHHQDVTRILRVCGLTVNTRVKEFEQTPSAGLTLEQFNTVELEREADPPAFTKNRIREARARAIQQKNYGVLTSGALDDPSEGKHAAVWRKGGRKAKLQADHDALYEELAIQLRCDDRPTKEAEEKTEEQKEVAQDLVASESAKPFENDPSEQQIVLEVDGSTDVNNPEIASMYPKSKKGRSIVLPNQATAEELQESTQPTEDKLDLVTWKEGMPDRDMEDIENLFRSDEEIAQKEAIFNKLNKDYIVSQERKESDRIKEEEAEKDKEQDEMAQAEGHARYMTKRGRKRRKAGDDNQTTEEALLAAVSSRKVSRKINYDAMSALFSNEGGFSTEGLEAEDPIQAEDNLFASV
jgi:transcription factor IIIB subunit 2